MNYKIALGNFYVLIALLLVGCTKNELPHVPSEPLPEGKYPITFTASIMSEIEEGAPKTRVADYEEDGGFKSKWTAGDVIKVELRCGNRTLYTHCTPDEAGNIIHYDPQLYWPSTERGVVLAWYSNLHGQATVTSGTVSLADQSNGLVYVIAGGRSGNYQSGNIELDFNHQLARVRVKLIRGTYTGSLDNVSLSVKGYTTCVLNKGIIDPYSLGNPGYIRMHKTNVNGEIYFEANLVPKMWLRDDAFELTVDNKTIKVDIIPYIYPYGRCLYPVEITINKAQP